ncbi:MAG: DUF3179 domain-containing protein [Flavobacteriales bacterium]|jgi:YD repeat-containing protein|nr:DUF3179 domain-containing protein [Flavobacteriales bacterium]MBK7085790.1 DUF3179 domain-containing protein [Flavobacteriales bacterium]MBK7268322.1 DUF3179 domain-containing protein [Flavobacteriales bacterium]MBK9074006.1 DUF3179 domain-containing protein [Flavobacteriales bacterium]MBK9539054.1 DUF3179 domain-containing protein [Flavobacteriales bacterium]
MRAIQFLAGVLLLLVPEILRVYYIMPFPGSQEDVATDLRQVTIAHWLHNHIWWVRLIGLALLAGPFIFYLRNGNWWKRVAVILPAALCALVFYAFNFKFMADKMFYPPKEKVMRVVAITDSTANSLVIAIEQNGDARAYPIELIGYHHQLLDTIGGGSVLVTYCTVCRTGRAWKPVVNGEPETFRLVGMDHFNAMFEDSRTGSWWRQVSGECIAGPLKGQRLDEIPSSQFTLGEFAGVYPNGLVFQPDPNFTEQYAGLEGFDNGTIASGLEYRDTASWQPKSWVVGVIHKGQARAYDWNDLSRLGAINDTISGDSIVVSQPNVIWSSRDTSFKSDTLAFLVTTTYERISAYQEFWHSWRTFHPNTTRYEPR